MQLRCTVSVLLFSVSALQCAEIERHRMKPKMTESVEEMQRLPPNATVVDGEDVGFRDAGLDRLKRAQGPITELYGCLLTLFLNPACWNRFENNQLRYLQYLYLRRRLQMLEQERLTGMAPNATEMREGKGPVTPPQDTPLFAKVLMRYFPTLAHKMMSVQTKAAQAKGIVEQSFVATAAQARALLPLVQQRVMATAGMAKALLQQTLAALAAPSPQQGQPSKSMPRPLPMPMRS